MTPQAGARVVERGFERYVAKDEASVYEATDEALVEGQAEEMDARRRPLAAADVRGGQAMRQLARKAWLVVALLLLAPLTADAGFWDGNKLKTLADAKDRIDLGKGTTADYHDSSVLTGYVAGVVDALSGSVFCVPPGTQLQQAIGIASKYIKDHPEEWGDRGSALVAAGLKQAFRCP
jgi:hypothetical protein